MATQKTALITGITGQDGSYLAELLLEKGYAVHGLVRRSSSFNTWRIDHIRSQLRLHYGDLIDQNSLVRTLSEIEPDELYNLAAQSHVKVSFEMPEYTVDVAGLGVLRLLDAVRLLKLPARIYQAGSSEMFGMVQETPQTEKTPFHPRSPYACAKVLGHWTGVNYREGYGVAHLQRHPLQPRVAQARREFRHAQDHGRRGGDQAGQGEAAAPR